MHTHSKLVREKLDMIIEEMASHPELFCKNPEKDFTRERKITFKSLIRFLLSIGGGSIYNELLEFYGYDESTATSSAFVQQRDKLLPITFEYLLHEFTNSWDNIKKFNGYRLLAVDGSDLNIARNPEDPSTYFPNPKPESKGYNLLHLNALYDLCNKLYVDATIQSRKEMNERAALAEMVDRSCLKEKVLLVADRGYESYNVFAHAERSGWKYVIRVKDKNSNGILSGLELPASDTFDINVNLILTKKQTKKVKEAGSIYKFVPSTSTFDFLDLDENFYYPMTFRVVRFPISEDTYETIITNVSNSEFSSKVIKEIYHMRWGIETSFRELKYSLGLINLHSKKTEYIVQEVFAKLVLYNFCEMITMQVIIQQKENKHIYQVNFTVAMKVCKKFFKSPINAPPIEVEALILKNTLPVRLDRKDPRNLKSKTTVSFLYRVA